MSGLVNALVIVVVIGVVIARQLRPRQVSAGGRWWLIPAVLVVMGVRDGGLIDPAHQELALGLLAAELIVGAAMGVVWAMTTRMWTEADGTVWSQGTKATIAVWVLGIAIRMALYGVAAAVGVHQHTGSILLAVGATLLVRAGVLMRRATHVESSYRTVS
jgi:hypothetical protein